MNGFAFVAVRFGNGVLKARKPFGLHFMRLEMKLYLNTDREFKKWLANCISLMYLEIVALMIYAAWPLNRL